MSTRREALEAAITAVEDQSTAPTGAVSVSDAPEGAIETPKAAPETESAQPREETGRFAPKQPDPAAVAADPNKVEQTAPPAKVRPRPAAPHSWKPEHRAKWDQLDPDIAAYINQREEETARGVEPLKRVWKEVSPYLETIQRNGVSPEYVVKDLLFTANQLATGDPQTKFATLMNIARVYNVPLQGIQGQEQQPVDPNIQALQQQVYGLQSHIQNFQHQQSAAQAAALDQQIEEFGKSHEHFPVLRETMARLLNAGEATDLDSAYTKAMRLHDDIWQRQQATQREAEEAKRRQEADRAAKAARANTVSTRSATPGNVAAKAGVATGRRAALEEAFNELTASRL